MSGNIVAGYEEPEMWKIFDAAADEVISRRDFEKWLVALGAFRNKPVGQAVGTGCQRGDREESVAKVGSCSECSAADG